MRNKAFFAGLAVLAVAVVGCADKSKPVADSSMQGDSAVLDVAAPAPAPAYVPPPPAPMPEPAVTSTPTAAGGSYVVKKGDTLYSIAKAKYGDGKAWKKIADANPGVNPTTLKVGQTLVLP